MGWSLPVKGSAARSLWREAAGSCNCSELTCNPPG